jgi:hypothetical protein
LKIIPKNSLNYIKSKSLKFKKLFCFILKFLFLEKEISGFLLNPILNSSNKHLKSLNYYTKIEKMNIKIKNQGTVNKGVADTTVNPKNGKLSENRKKKFKYHLKIKNKRNHS